MKDDVVTLPLEIGVGADREVQTLFTDAWRRLVLIRLRNCAILAAHSAVTPITIQCVLGSGVLNVAETQYLLTPGMIVPVGAHVEHSVVAEPNVAILVTFFRQPVGDARRNDTEQQDTQQALQEAEERYRNLVENARDVIFTLTPEGEFSSLNAVFAEAMGWPPQEWIGKSFMPLLHQDDVPVALALWRQVLQGEKPAPFEIRLSPKSATPLFAEILVSPCSRDGKVVSILGIARDVTERKRTEEAQQRAAIAEAAQKNLENEITVRKRIEGALREREARLAAIFRAVDEVILTVDLELTIIGVNQAIERVLQYKPDDVLAQAADRFLTTESAATMHVHTEQVLRGEPLPALFELEGVDKSGKLIPLEVSTSILGESERPVGMVCVLRDISLKKKLERQRADFLAMLTHDIKNPVHVILGYAELLLEDINDTEQRTLLQRLRSNALTLHSLVTNYLDLSKIESGHLTLAREPLAINSLLRQVVQQYEGEAIRQDITLSLQLQDDLPPLDADPLALERVFANLLNNALKFTPQQGQVTVRSSLRANAIVATIEDSGPGLPQEEIDALFEKYHQGMQARVSEGAGLGLFIVKAFVEAHGGHIEVASAPGRGSRFSVVVPVSAFLQVRSAGDEEWKP